jgi:two-component system NtrC family sensor kinase
MDFADAREAPEHLMPGRDNFLASGQRAITVMPMMRGETAIGAISVIHHKPRQLSDKQRELLRIFAAQAVIAIENTRLFNELRERTEDLTESLEQQTATADVLSVMSQSKFDLHPILQSVVDTAARLCRAEQAGIFRLDNGAYRFAAAHYLDPSYLEFEKATPYLPGPGTVIGRAARQPMARRRLPRQKSSYPI